MGDGWSGSPFSRPPGYSAVAQNADLDLLDRDGDIENVVELVEDGELHILQVHAGDVECRVQAVVQERELIV
jgi:hypothetical protein